MVARASMSVVTRSGAFVVLAIQATDVRLEQVQVSILCIRH